MPLFAIAFLIGDLYLQTYSQLPTQAMIYVLLAVSILIIGLAYQYSRYIYFFSALILGFVFSAWYAQSILSWSLPKEMEGRPILVTGYIASLPLNHQFGTRFFFSLERLQYENVSQHQKTLIRLSWRDVKQPLRVGDKYQLLVRLKRIHASQNPGSFDFEAWAVQSGLRATGYVLPNNKNQWLSHAWYRFPINQIRQQLQEKIQATLPKTPTSPWLMALTIGERNGIAQGDWQVLRNTGTNHLMAIAGLHIGIMAGLAHTIVSWIWRRVPRLVLRYPAMHAGAWAAVFIAISYSALAGFSIPTQRACIMLIIFIITLLARRKIHAWHAWSLALLIVLLLNPLSVLTESIWLSFGTIALIIYGMSGRLSPSGWWWKWGRVQWVVGIGLTPLTLMLFQQSSFISFIANSIAIPWLGFLILPFCFLSAIFLFISPSLGGLLLWIADKSLAFLWMILTYLSQWQFASWHESIPNFAILFLTVVGFVLLLLPAGFPGRCLGLVWIMPLIFYQPTRPTNGDYWVSVLDVGQGLSVVVQTKAHILVYDAGPNLGAGFDAGESIVLPYLRSMRAKQIDMLVVSHGDNDHIGGAPVILKNLKVKQVKTSTPDKLRIPQTQYCLAGDTWQWDGVIFSFLYPSPDQLNLGNDSSCVLKISNGRHSILLTGDIEKYAENSLLSKQFSSLSATILIAPHHGSKTSGLMNFIEAVHPQYVLYATGYRNRYHFPHQSVVNGYQKIHAVQLNTVEMGAVEFKLEKTKPTFDAQGYRIKNKRYWMDE